MARDKSQIKKVSRKVASIHAFILAFVMAVIGGMGLFLMTVWLIVRGGKDIGAHLMLLHHYFIGYSVTWPGSLVGLFYGALIGGMMGWLIGFVYNRIVSIRHQ